MRTSWGEAREMLFLPTFSWLKLQFRQVACSRCYTGADDKPAWVLPRLLSPWPGPSIWAGGLPFSHKIGQRLPYRSESQRLRGILASGETGPMNVTQLDTYNNFLKPEKYQWGSACPPHPQTKVSFGLLLGTSMKRTFLSSDDNHTVSVFQNRVSWLN